MIQDKFKIKIISQSNEVIVEKNIVKYEWITENKINTYDENDNKTRYFLGSSLLIIDEIHKND